MERSFSFFIAVFLKISCFIAGSMRTIYHMAVIIATEVEEAISKVHSKHRKTIPLPFSAGLTQLIETELSSVEGRERQPYRLENRQSEKNNSITADFPKSHRLADRRSKWINIHCSRSVSMISIRSPLQRNACGASGSPKNTPLPSC